MYLQIKNALINWNSEPSVIPVSTAEEFQRANLEQSPLPTTECEPSSDVQAAKRKRPSFDLFDLYGDRDGAPEDTARVSIETRVESEIRAYEDIRVSVDDTHLHFNVMEWWHSHQDILPMLSRYARFIHSIPATSAASERSFSAAGNMLTEKRSGLNPATLSSMLLLKSNWDLRNENLNL